MNKQTLALLALFGLLAAMTFGLAQATKDTLTSEIEDDEEFGPDGGIGSAFGSVDVLQDGVGNLIDFDKGPCVKSRSESACKNCCETTGKAYRYDFAFSLRKIKTKFHVCTCFERSPK